MADDFHEVQFPTDISYGSSGGPEFSTDVVILGGGAERRNQNWTYERARWDVAYGIKTKELLITLIEFFKERAGRATGFRFKDHDDFEATKEDMIVVIDLDVYQCAKNYTDAGGTYVKKISKPVSPTVQIYVDDVLQTVSVDYAIDYTTGIIQFIPGQEPGTGDTVTWSGQFDLPVRFDTDYLPRNFDTYEARSASVPIVELKL
jgi:uncharacterized protein (TIGR02217 family)